MTRRVFRGSAISAASSAENGVPPRCTGQRSAETSLVAVSRFLAACLLVLAVSLTLLGGCSHHSAQGPAAALAETPGVAAEDEANGAAAVPAEPSSPDASQGDQPAEGRSAAGQPSQETTITAEKTAAADESPAALPDGGEPAEEQQADEPASGEQPADERRSGEDDAKGGEETETEQDAAREDLPTREAEAGQDEDFPYQVRVPAPDFPKGAEWLNTSGPLRKQDLQGKFVLLDFWTYCCINCIHILPELKKLERAYPNELVVIGVHSAKFETEKEAKNIEEAILRYEIEHPVVNDPEHRIWQTFGVRSWPTVLLIDPQGNAVWGRAGEIKFKDVADQLEAGLKYYRDRGLLDATPIRFDLLARRQQPTPLRFPGKVLADEAGNRLFISDSNNNRIVVTTLDGRLLHTIGSGRMGRQDGSYAECSFDHPQGVALDGDTLYVADTENHLLRKVDLRAEQVTTIAGTGSQARYPWPGLEERLPGGDLPDRWVGPPKTTGLNSPWALHVHEDNLYIAMAGPHQIWKMPLDESEIGPYAGNGREDIVDGPLLPRTPYEVGYSSFAQPSGLTSDGTWLYVADSEGSSIRAVPFDPQGKVRTVVGTSELPYGRLFEFGDRDGERKDVLLQHVLGVSHHDGRIYIADTYNNKIKQVDAETGATRTLAGTGEPGLADDPAQFDEPAGVSYAAGTLYIADTNNHAIRTLDVKTGKVETLAIEGLRPPASRESEKPAQLDGAPEVAVAPVTLAPRDGKVTLRVQLQLPPGYKINPDAPMAYQVQFEEPRGPFVDAAAGRHKLDKPAAEFTVPLGVEGPGKGTVKVSLQYFYCQEGGEGLCKIGSVLFTVPLTIQSGAKDSSVTLKHVVPQ